jgi:hypothetical protein
LINAVLELIPRNNKTLLPQDSCPFSSYARFLAGGDADDIFFRGADSLQHAVFTVAASFFAIISVIVLSLNRRVWEWDNIFKEKVVALKSAQHEVSSSLPYNR